MKEKNPITCSQVTLVQNPSQRTVQEENIQLKKANTQDMKEASKKEDESE